MKKLALALTFLGCSLSATELTGYIVDAPCGWNNARSTPEAKDCAQKCVKAGWDPVFVPDGSMKTYPVSDKAKVMNFVGVKVVITGALTKDLVRVDKIRIAKQ